MPKVKTDQKMIVGDNEFGTLQDVALKELIRESKNNYWKNVLEESSNKVLIEKRSWFENKRKGYFYLMSACSVEGRVLDIGAGSGIVSDVVSNYFREVISLDYNPNLLEFMKLRFGQDKRNNIKLIRANALFLPFKDESFDMIILNGVLEWIPNFSPKKNPKNTQIDFLRDCLKKLKPEGKICVAIENRFYFNYLAGASPHGDISFTTVLPRLLADLISKIITGKPYLNYIYSSFGYKQLFKKTGLKNIEIFVALPSYYNPILILPINNGTINKTIMSSDILPHNRIKRIIYVILLKLGLLKYLLHSFYIRGEKVD